VFELYIGELFGVLRGYRKMNITVNCSLPIIAVILHGFPVHKFCSWSVKIHVLPAYIFFL